MLHGHPFRVNATKLLRRRFLHLAAGAATLPAVSRIAWAQTYPARPVRIVAGYPAGGTADIYARLIGQWLSERLRQPFIIENRPGASGTIAAESVVRAPPDGYTLLLASSDNAYNATLYDNLKFNFIRDITPVASIALTPGVMEVNPSFPAKSVPEFIVYAKANPGKINLASAGTGNLTHLCGELLRMMTGIDVVHVPYRGTPAAHSALLAGDVQAFFDAVGSSMAHIQAGSLRALGVTAAARLKILPDIPLIGDVVPGYAVTGWLGIGVPKGTPPEIIERLNREANAALADPAVRARMAELGSEPLPGSTGEFAKLIAEETEKWSEVVKFAGLKAE